MVNLQYFTNITSYKKIVALNDEVFSSYEKYEKSLFLNRARISGANGVINLSIPIRKGRNQRTPISEVEVSFDENWRKDHWKAILSSYNNSPWFEHYHDTMAAFYKQEFPLLIQWNIESLNIVNRMLGIKQEIHVLDVQPTNELNSGVMATLDARAMAKNPVPYPQVFQDRFGFIPDLSVIDLIFCTGPRQAKDYLIAL